MEDVFFCYFRDKIIFQMVQYDQPHSYVWPADYNWMKSHHTTDVSTVSQVNSPVSSTGNLKSIH